MKVRLCPVPGKAICNFHTRPIREFQQKDSLSGERLVNGSTRPSLGSPSGEALGNEVVRLAFSERRQREMSAAELDRPAGWGSPGALDWMLCKGLPSRSQDPSRKLNDGARFGSGVSMLALTPKALDRKAQGRAGQLGEGNRSNPSLTPKGLHHRLLMQPLRGGSVFGFGRSPRVRCATLGFVMKRLRRKTEHG